MEELAPTTSAVVGGSSASCGMSLSDLAIGLDVTIASRTWAGINRPGGRAKITAIDAGTDRIDVKYVLGGRERNLELMYVRPHVELERGSRGRKRDVKMNVDTLGGCGGGARKKKRKKKRRGGGNSDEEEKSSVSSKRGKRTALSFIDGNGGQQQGTTIATTEAAAEVDNESWTLIKVSLFIIRYASTSLHVVQFELQGDHKHAHKLLALPNAHSPLSPSIHFPTMSLLIKLPNKKGW